VIYDGLRLRTGRKVGRTLYFQLGPEPTDEDALLGMMDSASVAQEIVRRWNQAQDTADIEQAGEQALEAKRDHCGVCGHLESSHRGPKGGCTEDHHHCGCPAFK
jgi:hypothetical protein